MEITYKVLQEKGLTKVGLQINLSQVESKVTGSLIESSDFAVELISELSKVNDVGQHLYDKMDLNNGWSIQRFFRGGRCIVISKNIVTEGKVKALAEKTMAILGKELKEAVKIPDIDMRVADICLPQDVVNKIQKHGGKADFSYSIDIKKDRGFNVFWLISHAKCSDNIRDLLLNSYKIRHENTDYSARINFPPSYVDFTFFDVNNGGEEVNRSFGLDHSHNVMDTANNIAEQIRNVSQKIVAGKQMNIFIGAGYKPFKYSAAAIKLFSDDNINACPSLSEFVLKDVSITREWLLSDVSVSFSFALSVFFSGRDKSYPMKLQFGDMTESRDFVISQREVGYYFNFHDKATIEKRLVKLLSGEDAVIDEVEKENEDLVKAVISQIKEQIVSSLESARIITKKDNFWELAAEEKDDKNAKDYWVNGKHIVFTGTVSMSEATRNEVAPVLVEEKLKMS